MSLNSLLHFVSDVKFIRSYYNIVVGMDGYICLKHLIDWNDAVLIWCRKHYEQVVGVEDLKNIPKIENEIRNQRSARWLPSLLSATPKKTPTESAIEPKKWSGAASMFMFRFKLWTFRPFRRLKMCRNPYKMTAAMNMKMNHCKIGFVALRGASGVNFLFW